MLSNAYFLAKFRFDTAENEPAKNLQNFANFPNFPNFANRLHPQARHEPREAHQQALVTPPRAESFAGGGALAGTAKLPQRR